MPKISELTNITGANLADNDEFVVVDTDAGVTKAVTRAEFFKDTPNVGIGTASPGTELEVAGSGEIIRSSAANGVANFMAFYDATGRKGYLGYGGATEDMTLYNERSGFLRFGTNGSTRMQITSAGDVGIGTTSPSEKLDVVGNVTISGSLSKGSGSFKIDHPLKPDTHYLVHSFLEGPQADNIYRGKVGLVNGTAIVNLDEAARMTEGTFAALNGNIQCFTSNESGWTAVRGSVVGNILTIEAQDATCTDEVSWLVIGERIDQHMLETSWTDDAGRIITEPEKPQETLEE